MNRAAGLLTALAAYAACRWRDLTCVARSQVERRDRQQLRRFLRHDLPKAGFYAHDASGPGALADLPVIDKSVVMADFSKFNLHRISNAEGWEAFAGSRRIGSLTVGASTGTSGNRGLFVISDRERYRWLGVILAKALPGFWMRRHRVAVILPLNTPLYEAANSSRVLTLKFFDITLGPQAWREDLEDFNPHVLIAPPKILVWLAQNAACLNPPKVFSAAETLDPPDRAIIESRFGAPLGQIYMATEGLLAVSCRLGTLHLCEDTMHFELEPAGEGLVTPVITDFSRKTQIIARYRMNDLLRLAIAPCACGSPFQAVAEIAGRSDDCFRLQAEDGVERMVTPDVMRNAILDASRAITDFRLAQTGAATVELMLEPDLADAAAAAATAALRALFDRHGVVPGIKVRRAALPLETARKRRRVENRHKGGAHG